MRAEEQKYLRYTANNSYGGTSMNLLRSLLFLGLAGSALAQPVTLNFTASGSLTGASSYAITGTGTITAWGPRACRLEAQLIPAF